MKFLCDQMLARVGRWLRAAGYDTLIVQDNISDKEIMTWAVRDNRFLLTRDRHFLEMSDDHDLVIWLAGNTLHECIEEMNKRLPIDWLLSPFSRCLICNTILIESPFEARKSIPEDILRKSNEFRYCPQCSKVYWYGSHTNRMLERLNEWKNGS